MHPAPSKRQLRDRDCGLTFSWRLPVSKGLPFFWACLTTAILALTLSSTVKVNVSSSLPRPERRASLVMLDSSSSEGRALAVMALEAGPFPARERPGKDPAVKALSSRLLGGLMPSGASYSPVWQDIPLPKSKTPAPLSGSLGVLPALPKRTVSPSPESLPKRPLRAVTLTAGEARLMAGDAPDGVREGASYLVQYDSHGFVVRVSPPGPEDPGPYEGWLYSARVEKGSKEGGWLAVEAAP